MGLLREVTEKMAGETSFDIRTAEDFLKKLLAEYQDFLRNPSSACHAINVAMSAYHLHEWVWGDRLKRNPKLKAKIGIAKGKKEGFEDWLRENCPGFDTVECICNGTKHFGNDRERKDIPSTRKVSGYGKGPYGIGPHGQSYLLIKHSNGTLQTAADLLKSVVEFWQKFFDQYLT